MPLPKVYWLDNPYDSIARVKMYNLFARSSVHHVAVPTLDTHHDCQGHALQANTLSHIRALRQIHRDRPSGQVAYVVENTLSYEYTPFWTTTLQRIIQNAPANWGVLQLAYICGPATASIIRNTPSKRKHVHIDDPFCIEKTIQQSAFAPFIPWKEYCTMGTCFYVVHPRGYRDILKHVKQYKYDPLYCKHKIPRFSPYADASHLFALTNTYTLNVPLFTSRSIPPSIHYQFHNTQWYIEHKKRIAILVRAWYDKYIKWQAQRRKQLYSDTYNAKLKTIFLV